MDYITSIPVLSIKKNAGFINNQAKINNEYIQQQDYKWEIDTGWCHD